MAPLVRPARKADRAGPRLLYLSAQPYYDAYTGSAERSQRMLDAIWDSPGHTASHQLCVIAELDATVAGAMVGFPCAEGDALARRFLTASLRHLPVWHWPHVFRHLRAAAEVMPVPPGGSFYVDGLAVDPGFRRRGVATALLAAAEEAAARHGLDGVSLDTGLANHDAQALYAANGFEVRGQRRAPSAQIAAAIGGAGFVSYFKALDPPA